MSLSGRESRDFVKRVFRINSESIFTNINNMKQYLLTLVILAGLFMIGAQAQVTLLDEGFEVVVVDNLVNASPKSLERVKQITGREVTDKDRLLIFINHLVPDNFVCGDFSLTFNDDGSAFISIANKDDVGGAEEDPPERS